MSILLFPAAFILLTIYAYLRHRKSVEKRDNRVRRVIYQKMAERGIDLYELACTMGVKPGFVHGLLSGKQRIEAIAAGGLAKAFPCLNPEKDLQFWYDLDTAW